MALSIRRALIGLFVILTTLTVARSVAVTADPELRYTGSAGCGDVFLYGFNQNHKEVLLVRVDLKRLNLGVGTHVVDVADAKEAVTIQVDEYRTPQDPLPYCTDIAVPGAERASSKWRARAGKATLTIGERGAVAGSPAFMYKATVQLDDLVFVDSDGRMLRAPAPITLTGTVGWVVG
jgi:hypothetical protein